MQLTMTKIVPVIFKESGKFRHPDGTRSWHKAGYVHNADTGEKLGPAMYTFSKDYLDSFAYNQKDLDYAIREGTKCQFLCFTGKDNKDYAIEVKKARELVKTGNAILITPTDGKSPFYRFDLCDITGERLESPF
jgi:hypothetical protein